MPGALNLKVHWMASRLGRACLASDGEGLHGFWFEGQRHFPEDLGPETAPDALILEAVRQVEAYLAGRLRTFDLPLARKGTDFQAAVWEALAAIPFGTTTTYGQLALDLGRPQASRAVGAAVGRNPWSLIVPCHRVLGSQGSLTGYAGGLDRKAALLALEQGQPGPWVL